MTIKTITLNPNDKNGTHTLSNGNLTDIIASAYANIRATDGKTSGKWYWEVKLISGNVNVYIGITNKLYPITSTTINGATGDALNIRAYNAGSSLKYPENTPFGATWAVGDVIGIALDMDNGKLEFYKNGVNLGVSHTNLLVLGEVFPLISATEATTRTITVNFGATAFAYSIPSGYQAYNVYPVNKFLISSSDGEVKSYIKNIPYDLCNGGVATASHSSNMAIQAFNNKISSTYNTDWWYTANAVPSWIQYEFVNPEIVDLVRIFSYALSEYEAIKDFTILASNTGLFNGEEKLLYTGMHPNDTTKDFVDYRFTNKYAYKFYRISISTIYPGNGGNNTSIVEIEMMNEHDISTMKSMDSAKENNFINYGIDSSIKLDTSINYGKKQYIKSTTTVLGSGKTFEHKIDLNRYKINKVTVQ